jgi:hypothetical protein
MGKRRYRLVRSQTPRLPPGGSLLTAAASTTSENNFYDQRKLTDAIDVLREVTQNHHRYILAIAIGGHYFEN